MLASRSRHLVFANVQLRLATTYKARDEEAVRPIFPGRTSDNSFRVFMVISD
jgi:hypothetical protein